MAKISEWWAHILMSGRAEEVIHDATAIVLSRQRARMAFSSCAGGICITCLILVIQDNPDDVQYYLLTFWGAAALAAWFVRPSPSKMSPLLIQEREQQKEEEEEAEKVGTLLIFPGADDEQ